MTRTGLSTEYRHWLFVMLSVPGVIGFFLPFYSGYSALDAAMMWPDDSGTGSLGLVMGLAHLTLAWHLRRALAGPLSRPEKLACAALGLAGSLLTAGIFLHAMMADGFLSNSGLALIIAVTFVVFFLPAAHAYFAFRFRTRILHEGSAAVATLTAGYLPNAVICLLMFYDGLQIGAYTVLTACCCYVGMIAATASRLGAARQLLLEQRIS